MGRYHLHRAGVLNVWQYDEQVFVPEGGRLLLRGANGAGKSKTMEMLLPFVLDGDKARMTASGRHHTSLLWLMQEGSTGAGTRTGYLWVEFARDDGETITCAVGLRHSTSAKTATSWMFTVPGPAPQLSEDDGTPLSLPRCRERVAELGGQLFEQARAYKEHVGRLLFGLDPQRYDDLLRLLYWLRQPQVGEDIEPARLAQILDVALPELDEDAVRTVGESLDDLAEHGERLERMERAAEATATAAEVYRRYARTELGARASDLLAVEQDRSRRARTVAEAGRRLQTATSGLSDATAAQAAAERAHAEADAAVRVLESGPLARNQQVLQEKQRRAGDLRRSAASAAAWASTAQSRADTSAARVEVDTTQVRKAAAEVSDQVRGVTAGLVDNQVPATLTLAGLAVDEPLAAELVEQLAGSAQHARAQVSGVQAAVTVVTSAAVSAEDAERVRHRADEQVAEAEQRQEQAAGRLADAAADLTSEVAQVEQLLQSWLDAGPADLAARGVPDLTPSMLDALPVLAREAAGPELASLRAREAAAGSRRLDAERTARDLRGRREQVLAERDPAPPGPALPRPGRADADGLPLWRLVDVAPGEDGALIEAALQASGLLDAHVRRDGSVLGGDELDTVLPLGPPLDGPTLADALRPDPPTDSGVEAELVARLLTRVAVADRVEGGDGPPTVGRDGSWRLGPLTGRASKPAAQYVGAQARAAERERRLVEVAEAIAAGERRRDEAVAEEAEVAQRRAEVERWVADLPRTSSLRSLWVRRDEREAEHGRAAAATRTAVDRAEVAARALARAHAELARLAAQHRLPQQRSALQARSSELTLLDRSLEALVRDARALLVRAARLEEDVEATETDAGTARDAAAESDAAGERAAAAEQESAALLATLGVEVQQLQRRLDDAVAARQRAAEDQRAVTGRVLALTGEQGRAQADQRAAEQRLEEVWPQVSARARALLVAPEVPGLVEAALGRQLDGDESLALAALRGAASAVPRAALDLVRGLAVQDERATDVNAVHAEVRTLAAGPAADVEPRVVAVHDTVTVLARDETGAELPLSEVAARLAGTVVRERELLTDRERTLFEEHLLGELGDRLRTRRLEALDLVKGMNDLLDGVRTSQGIRVRLDWELREDSGSDVADVVRLIGRPLGALLAEERSRLRAALHALIEAQRAAEPERGYAEHLAQALDYRRWSAFRVRLSRPEQTGWSVLTRRTPLSQGEQKVVCYLPLFAAAAAHYTSIAGASPDAPRLVLLDDAFPKIDVRTHPLLFGLLVDLDLDFVITSERLWGDHETVPSLAIYEALRSPAERGIAQYRYVWDGRRLVTHGAS